MPFISLLTDFGLRDPYVGILKGVIYALAPQVQLIDLTHGIPPQDVAAARFALMTAYPHLPPGTIHLAVVDPGVGSARRAIALQIAQGYLVGPDNGLFSGVLVQSPALAAVELNNSRYWCTPKPSSTFHGRDLFAPVAAHLANGIPLAELGDPIDLATLATLDWPEPKPTADGYQAVIQAIDHFGNCISTLPEPLLKGRNWRVWVRGTRIPAAPTFAGSSVGELIAVVGSSGWLEIAQNQGNASQVLNLRVGDEIRVEWG